jgi:hypothetical protein
VELRFQNGKHCVHHYFGARDIQLNDLYNGAKFLEVVIPCSITIAARFDSISTPLRSEMLHKMVLAIVLAVATVSTASTIDCVQTGSFGGNLPDVTESNGKFSIANDQSTYSTRSAACQQACFRQFKYHIP